MKSLTITAKQYNKLYESTDFDPELPPTDEWKDYFAGDPVTEKVDIATSFEIFEDGSFQYMIGDDRYTNNYRWDGMQFENIQNALKAQEIISHFENSETDIFGNETKNTEICTSASFLHSLGWEFSQDYENWKNGNYKGDPYTEEELSSYEAYLEATTVYILVYNQGGTVWGSLHNSTERTPEGYDPTGNDKQTLLDISENLKAFSKA